MQNIVVSSVCMVVPCKDEELRLDPGKFIVYLRKVPGRFFVFVDDGSRDRTCEILQQICKSVPGNARLIRLKENRGKAGAVREGMMTAEAWKGFTYIGYMDADLSTPMDEIDRFVDIFNAEPGREMLMGSRLHPRAQDIIGHGLPGFAGRIFSRIISKNLGQRFYDTQCGFKILRQDIVRKYFGPPFRTKWIFDVELLGRVLASGSRSLGPAPVLEVPLERWEGRKGSRISLWKKVCSMLYLPVLLLSIRK